LNSGYWPGFTTNWWWTYLAQYIPSATSSGATNGNNNVWVCPEVNLNLNISASDTIYFHSVLYGYGPIEGVITATQPDAYYNGILRYAYDSTSAPYSNPLGSRNLAGIRRTSQIWLVGDVGHPMASAPYQDAMPSSYYTDVDTKPPLPTTGWTAVSGYHQPACRHNGGTAVFSLCDGHVELWKWASLRADNNDVFAEYSY
jgi:prepilin-type processing-associated H-X9-DG protein